MPCLTLRTKTKTWYIRDMKKPKPTRRNIALKKLFASTAYKEWFESVSNKYEEFGVPLPSEPIPEPTCICGDHQSGWYKEVNDKVIETQNSLELKKALDELRDENGKIEGHEKVEKAHELEEKYTLEPIGMYIDYLVCTHMGIDRFKDVRDREIYVEFIRKKILHGADEYVSPITVSRRPHGIGKRKEPALWLKIEPEATKEDLADSWDFVKQWQKELPDYKERYRSYPNLERDVRIGELYEELKDDSDARTSIALRIASKIEDEDFGEVYEETINKVISEYKKSKGET